MINAIYRLQFNIIKKCKLRISICLVYRSEYRDYRHIARSCTLWGKLIVQIKDVPCVTKSVEFI